MEEKLNNKTCGECKHYLAKMFHCQKHDVMAESHQTCEDFEPRKKLTNGDRIRSMSDEELAELITQPLCYCCGYNVDRFGNCNRPAEMSCEDAILEWLKKEAKA